MAQFPARGTDRQRGVADFIIEDVNITVSDSNTGTQSLSKSHAEAPFVVITKNFSAGLPHVNVYLSAISTSSITVESTYPFTGTVKVRAISRIF